MTTVRREHRRSARPLPVRVLRRRSPGGRRSSGAKEEDRRDCFWRHGLSRRTASPHPVCRPGSSVALALVALVWVAACRPDAMKSKPLPEEWGKADGSPCESTLECESGSICNSLEHQAELFRPDSPAGTCVPAFCPKRKCQAPEECSPRGLCEVRACTEGDQCPSQTECFGGSCSAPALLEIHRCALIAHSSVAPGNQVRATLVAFDARGQFVFSDSSPNLTSSNLDAVAACGSGLCGTNLAGASVVSGRVGLASCAGRSTVWNFGPHSRPGARVVVVGFDGDPVRGATVSFGGDDFAVTDRLGRATLVPQGLTTQITIQVDSGRTTILAPSGSDTLVRMSSRAARPHVLRGVIRPESKRSASWLKRGEAWIGAVARPIDKSFREALDALGPPIEGTRDGVVLTLPGGIVTEWSRVEPYEPMPMNDFDSELVDPGLRRCPHPVAADEVGCFRLRVRDGADLVWVAGTAIQAGLLGELEQVLGGVPRTSSFVRLKDAGLLFDAAPLAYHLVSEDTEVASVGLPNARKESFCFVEVPKFDGPFAETGPTLSVAAFSDLGNIGLVPLGISVAATVGGEARPESPESITPPRTVPLVLAAPPGRPRPLVFAVTALDTRAWAERRPARLSTLFFRAPPGPLPRIVASSAQFLVPPRAVLYSEGSVLELSSIDSSATVVELRLDRDEGPWRIMAEPGTLVTLPEGTLRGVRSATVSIMRMRSTWDDLWALQNEGTQWEAPDFLEAIAESPCGRGEDAPCRFE